MKLYATVTSERASKGQGGQKLHIVINNEEQKPAIALFVRPSATGRVLAIVHQDITRAEVEIKNVFLDTAIKGEKEKGE